MITQRPLPPRLDTVAVAAKLGLTEKQVRARCARGEFQSARKGEGRSARWTVAAAEVEALAGNGHNGAIDVATLRQVLREELRALVRDLVFGEVLR